MSPTRSEYSKLGLELVSLEYNRSRTPKKPSMAEEKKIDGADDPISLLLEQALTRQRDECWVCVIFFARVVVFERLRRARRGVRGGVARPPLGGCRGSGAVPPIFFFLADIFSPGRHISGTT
jgi:hypothetical protein